MVERNTGGDQDTPRIFDARSYRDRLDQSPAALTILDFATAVRARLRLFNDTSHYDSVPEPSFQRELSRWWSLPSRGD